MAWAGYYLTWAPATSDFHLVRAFVTHLCGALTYVCVTWMWRTSCAWRYPARRDVTS